MDFDELKRRVAKDGSTSEAVDSSDSEICDSKKHAEGNIRPRTAFVIMPFSDGFRDTYLLGISAALGENDYACRRVDEIEFSGRVMNEIQDNISSSAVIVAELTEPNPNVYYELGIAHALGKYVILCTKNASDIPFDIRDMNHIVYRDIFDLKERLSKHIESLVMPDHLN